MTTPEEKAQEIDRALKDRKDSDQAVGDKLDKILGALDDTNKRIDALDDMNKRLEAVEARDRADANGESRAEVRSDDNAPLVSGGSYRPLADLVKAQARADSVSMMFGTQAPRPMDGEQLQAYRIRLLQNFQHNSPEFKAVDLNKVTDAATFDAIESRIYADSTAAAATPLVPAGFLREIRTRDDSGRQISKFYGEPRSWMQQFMAEPSVVEKINKKFDSA